MIAPSRSRGLRGTLEAISVFSIAIAIALISPHSGPVAQDVPEAPHAEEMQEASQTSYKLRLCLADYEQTTSDPRDPAHHRITRRYSKAILKEKFGWRTQFHRDGFSYAGQGGRRQVYLVGGPQWIVTQDRDYLIVSSRATFRENPDLRSATHTNSPGCILFPWGFWSVFNLEPTGIHLVTPKGLDLKRRIDRIRLGSKWRPLPFSGLKVCGPTDMKNCIKLSGDGRADVLMGLGSTKISAVPEPDGRSFTVSFIPKDPEAPINKDRFYPIRVHRMADSGKPAFWPLEGSTFAYLTPADEKGECEIRIFDFYDKGQYHVPLPKVVVGEPFRIVPIDDSEPKFFWTARGQTLFGFSEDYPPVSIQISGARSGLIGLDGDLNSSELTRYRDLSPYLLNWDCSGYSLISWKPLPELLFGQGSPRRPLEYEVFSGIWDLGELFGEGCPDFRAFDLRGGSLIAAGVSGVSGAHPHVQETHIDLASGASTLTSWGADGLSAQGRLLAIKAGWFLFWDPTPAPHLLCLFQETGYSREVCLPAAASKSDPRFLEFIWGEERVKTISQRMRAYDPIFSGD